MSLVAEWGYLQQLVKGTWGSGALIEELKKLSEQKKGGEVDEKGRNFIHASHSTAICPCFAMSVAFFLWCLIIFQGFTTKCMRWVWKLQLPWCYGVWCINIAWELWGKMIFLAFFLTYSWLSDGWVTQLDRVKGGSEKLLSFSESCFKSKSLFHAGLWLVNRFVQPTCYPGKFALTVISSAGAFHVLGQHLRKFCVFLACVSPSKLTIFHCPGAVPVHIISIRMQVTSLLTASSFTVPCALCAHAEPLVVFSFKPEPLDVCE